MKIFITGSSGFIGSHLLSEILKLSSINVSKIFLLEREPALYNDHRIEVLRGDLAELNKFSDQIRSVDYFFHLAASADFNSTKSLENKETDSLKLLIEILKGSSIKRLIFTSTIGAYDRASNDNTKLPISNSSVPAPRSVYGKNKLFAEKLVFDSKIPFTIFRPTWVWGRRMRLNSHISFLYQLILKRSPMASLGFSGKASFIHVTDLCRAMIQVLDDNEKFKNLAFFAATENRRICDVQMSLIKLSGERRKLFTYPFKSLSSRLHRFFPLGFNFMFHDYLWVDPDPFIKAFNLQSITSLDHSLGDVRKSQRSVLITGANGGIGFELAKILKPHFELILVDKNIDNLQSLFSGEKLIQGDLTEDTFLDKIVDTTQKVKNLYGILNNAGVGFKSSFDGMEQNKAELTIKLNCIAPVRIVYGLKSKILKDKTIILNTASSVGFYPLPGMSVYAATKAFTLSWSNALMEEIPHQGVITFCPSGTRTNFQRNAGVKETNDLMSAQEVAVMMANALIKGKSALILLGAKSKVLNFILLFLPIKLKLRFLAKLFMGSR